MGAVKIANVVSGIRVLHLRESLPFLSLSLFLEDSASTRCHPSYALLGGDSKGVRKGGGRRESDACLANSSHALYRKLEPYRLRAPCARF